jgi:hypothetical protein
MKHNRMEDGKRKTEDGKNIQPQMERELKAIIQQYMERMTQDRLR